MIIIIICKYHLLSLPNNHSSVSVTFVSDASHSASGTNLVCVLLILQQLFPQNVSRIKKSQRIPASFTFPSKGFRLAYQLAPCSRTYSQPHGRVLSPSWPHRLPRNQNTLFELTINNIFIRNLTCSFTITAPTGRFVSVFFRYMAIASSPNCSSSHLEVETFQPTTINKPHRFMMVPLKLLLC